ncbi:ScbR family autoregulator-binding transcription factor [Streptomyces sp. NPDC015125]|uniref:ScbR family autoregulator-binding transcription factor n=1 Tax=Streptomyces sp. NPDC015125 TaxID=3364938 RepID=UPI0036FBB39A
MAKRAPQQDRAIRTRRRILLAAASSFADLGYDKATIEDITRRAGVTKGSLYFHFKNKDELACAVLDAQLEDISVPPQDLKLQELVDSGYLLAMALLSDPIQRGATRLALDQGTSHLDRAKSMNLWGEFVESMLTEARKRGEIFGSVHIPHIAELFVACFAGIQNQSNAKTNRQDLSLRLTVFWDTVLRAITRDDIFKQLSIYESRANEVADQIAILASSQPCDSSVDASH